MAGRTTTAGEPVGGREGVTVDERFRDTRAFKSAQTFAGMWRLGTATAKFAVRSPLSWVGSAISEAGFAARRCVVPLVISHMVYLLGFGIVMLCSILSTLGLVDRAPGVMTNVWNREVSTWITGMVFAGVVGSAMTADLGSRKIREELDALDVLGVPRLSTLIAPRVLGLTIAAPVLTFFSLFMIMVVGFVMEPAILGFSHSVFLQSLIDNARWPDMIVTVLLKMTLVGFFVGVVSCYKGLHCSAGAESVGRAVNEAVVITFFGIWMFNGFFNLAYFSLFPQVVVFRG